jgi:hypothetical protein
LADDEVDMAFATALREAAAHPPPPTPGMQALVDRIKQLQVRVNADQQQIQQLGGSGDAAVHRDVPVADG